MSGTETEMNENVFLYDDFFLTESATEDLTVTLKGRPVTFKVKQYLSLGDRQAAYSAATKYKVGSNGKLELAKLDEMAMAVELLARLIVSWPFRFSDGSPVPITVENIKKLVVDPSSDLLVYALNKFSNVDQKKPFTTPSASN